MVPALTLSPCSIPPSKVAALDHEARDDAVEAGPLVGQRLARGASALLTWSKNKPLSKCATLNRLLVEAWGGTRTFYFMVATV
jgi:hypothetical protein